MALMGLMALMALIGLMGFGICGAGIAAPIPQPHVSFDVRKQVNSTQNRTKNTFIFLAGCDILSYLCDEITRRSAPRDPHPQRHRQLNPNRITTTNLKPEKTT
jgi:hypothetical protein